MRLAIRNHFNHVALALVVAIVGVAGSSAHGQDASAEAKSPPHIKVYAPGAESPSVIKINEALEQVTSLEFPGNPLEDVVRYIGSIHEIPIVVDESALLAEGIGPDTEVKIALRGVTLRSALELMFEDVGGIRLDYVIQHEVLKITTAIRADEILETRVYDIRALDLNDPEILVETLTTTTSGHWLNAGDGEGAISYTKGLFIIRQTQRVHREIENLLNDMAHHVNSGEPIPDWPAPRNEFASQGQQGGVPMPPVKPPAPAVEQ
ncbi:MAG: hypothetical protein KDA88_00135 [Planctomycetaceae bacterium]|nr:hypothetical protein [Planctomycetaceae bacterium]MCB9950262.1 hypothetical protein [Planctomycetaceae bacterium]